MADITEISVGATPTLQFLLPTSIDLSGANIYFSIEQFKRTVIEKSNTDNEDVSFEGNTVSVYLSQIDTLQLEEGDAKAMLNITKQGGKVRIPTYEAPLKMLHNEIKKVLT